MNSTENGEWFSQQMELFGSLEPKPSADSLKPAYASLPPIPEEGWDFEWEKDLFTDSSEYACFEKATNVVVEPKHGDASPTGILEELASLRNEVQQLRRDISELQDLFTNRLDAMERSVLIGQRYVNKLLPWSIEVHEKYSKLLEMAKRQEEAVVG
tara:strand:+ start:758 stop:1225 length:468 start_codon:yes stop_codon:yes gene_type:complete